MTVFGRKKKETARPAPRRTAKKTDYVGFRYGDPALAPTSVDANAAFGISAEERVHTAIFGLPGCGKSSILKLLIYQNIRNGQGFMVIDPHGELARDVMRMIPESRHQDVIYVNPASLYRFGRTVQINPLEVKSEDERYVVVMGFVNMLQNLYKDSWGPRLETVLRNAANALVETKEHNRLFNISAMITDEGSREAILDDVASKPVRHFWEEIFAKQYAKDAGSSAYNKIDKILSTPTVAAMLDAAESSISIQDIIENRRMLIVDLSTGASDDICQFLGSIFLNMVYVYAKKRIDIHGDSDDEGLDPFYLYADEAHMFSNTTMSEMLRALRKFNIKMTIATQTCNAYDREFSMEIPGVCKTIITGRCDYNTANLFRANMSMSVEDMQKIPSHSFALASDEGGVRAHGVFRSRPVPLEGDAESAGRDWKEVAKKSAARWGRQIMMEKYIPRAGIGKLLFTPVEACIVHLMHFDNRDWYREEIFQAAKTVFPGILERHIAGALDKLTRELYVRIMYPKSDDSDQHDSIKRYVLGERSSKTYLSEAYGGRRAGGEGHNDVLFKIADENRRRHRYCIPDLGQGGDEAPDLLIIEPGTVKSREGYMTYDPHRWNEKNRLAVEVETDPGKHMEHSVYNYTKNHDRGYDVWFVCFEERHRERLEEAIRQKHPPFEGCKMDTINAGRVLKGADDLPETFEETFTDVAVRKIDEILKTLADDTPLERQPTKSTVPREALADASKGTRDLAEVYTNTVGSSREDVKSSVHVPAADPPPGHIENETQWAILDGIRKAGAMERDADLIREKFGIGRASRNEIKGAIEYLLMKKMLRQVYYSRQKKTGSLDGSGDRKTSRRVAMLVPFESHPESGSGGHPEPAPPADQESDTGHDPEQDPDQLPGEKPSAAITDFDASEYTDIALAAMLADETQKANHAAAKAELDRREDVED